MKTLTPFLLVVVALAGCAADSSDQNSGAAAAVTTDAAVPAFMAPGEAGSATVSGKTVTILKTSADVQALAKRIGELAPGFIGGGAARLDADLITSLTTPARMPSAAAFELMKATSSGLIAQIMGDDRVFEQDNDSMSCRKIAPNKIERAAMASSVIGGTLSDSQTTAATRDELAVKVPLAVKSFLDASSGRPLNDRTYVKCHWSNNDDTEIDVAFSFNAATGEVRAILGAPEI
jgi:hypothetical protein